jgi:hypothetical protein
MRQALQRFGCLFETCRDLVGIRPRRGIEPFGERKERLLPFGIRRALRNLLADRGIPLRQKRDLLVGVAPSMVEGTVKRGVGGGCCCKGAPSTAPSPPGRLRGRRGSVAVSITCWL